MKQITIFVDELDREFLLDIGQSKEENDKIIKNSHSTDIWFHLDNISSPHFVFHTQGTPLSNIPKKYLNNIATLFTDYKKGLGRKYKVIYTEIKHLSLTQEQGTVIPRKLRYIKC